MSKITHTPGPWTIRACGGNPADGTRWYQIVASNTAIAEIGAIRSPPMEDVQDLTDAVVMAAAPDMLATISYAVAALGAIDPGDVTPAAWDLLVRVREQLIEAKTDATTLPADEAPDDV